MAKPIRNIPVEGTERRGGPPAGYKSWNAYEEAQGSSFNPRDTTFPVAPLIGTVGVAPLGGALPFHPEFEDPLRAWERPYTSPTEGYEPSKPGSGTPPPDTEIDRPTNVDNIYDDIFGPNEPQPPGPTPRTTPPGTTGKRGTTPARGTDTGAEPFEPEPPPTPRPTPTGGPGTTGKGTYGPTGMDRGEPGAPPDPGTDPNDPFNMTSYLNDWQDYAINLGSLTQLMNEITVNIPGMSEGMAIYGGVLKELEELIRTKGEAGLTGTFEEEYDVVAGAAGRAAKTSRTKALGDMVRRGIVQSGVSGEILGGIQSELEAELVNLAGNIQRERSNKAAAFYSQAQAQKMELGKLWTESGYKGYDLALKMAQTQDDSQRAWAEMGLHEQLTMQGYNVEKYKADIQANMQSQRLALEEQLGFADINIREMLVENEWNLENMKMALQEKLVDKGIEQQELDRALQEWTVLMQSEIATRRNDIDLLNVMGSLSNQEWQLQIQEAELEMKRWMTEEQFNLQRQQMGQDWQQFIETQAMNRWIAEGNWMNQLQIAQLYANAQGGSWLGDLMSFAGDVLGGK